MTARRRTHRARPRDDGSASLELTIVFPVLLLVVFALVQFALWFHARTLALAAASEGVTVARAYGSTPAAGRDRAAQFLAHNAGDLLTATTVTASTPSSGHVTIEVTGRTLSLLPLTDGLVVTQSSTGPVERFSTMGDP